MGTPTPRDHLTVDRDSDLVSDVELDDGQLAYDCTAWAGESRGLLASLLTSRGVAHAWQGTVLAVREQDEELVDMLVDEVLASAESALDPGAPRIVYEVGSWPVAVQTELTDGLTAADVPYEWNEQGDLVVNESDEDLVEAVLDELSDPEEGGISADDGIGLHELLDRLFMASDRLARHPVDAAATLSLIDDSEVLSQVALPFGFEQQQWRQLVDSITSLSSAVEGDPDSDEEVVALARAARDLLRTYV